MEATLYSYSKRHVISFIILFMNEKRQFQNKNLRLKYIIKSMEIEKK